MKRLLASIASSGSSLSPAGQAGCGPHLFRSHLCRALSFPSSSHSRSFSATTGNRDTDNRHSRPSRVSLRAPSISRIQQRLHDVDLSCRDRSLRERSAMAQYYSPQQLQAIMAADVAVDNDDISLHGSLRSDTWRLDYLDDFTRLRPILDPTTPANEHDTSSAISPPIPTLSPANFGGFLNDSSIDHTKLHTQRVGLSEDTIQNLYIKDVNSHRVMNQTKLGKIQSIYYIAIAGNQNGWIGYGEGKASSAAEARKQAQRRAIRNMAPIPLYESRTIFGEVSAKAGGTTVSLSARPPGFGLRCQHIIFEICRAAGISDISARVGRSRNKMNTVRAAISALQEQKIPSDVAIGRGRKLVDLRKVYYDGNVL